MAQTPDGVLETYLETLAAEQQQLIIFARLFLQRKLSLIRLFDEFTLMADVETEATMINLIREEFQDGTVIAVTHRLNTGNCFQ
ncbi:ABC transporter [Penicillium longicatenatum]|nr:ABC transporter [Penicillium longicatenatum]